MGISPKSSIDGFLGYPPFMETLIDPQTLVELHLQLWLPKTSWNIASEHRNIAAVRLPDHARRRFDLCFDVFLPKKK